MMKSSFPYRRIIVVGTTSSGKSTLAERLAIELGLDFIELDALHWEPNWVEAPVEVFRSRVKRATQAQAWVVAGNYHVVRDLVWPRAEAVIWPDYSLWAIFWRLWRRKREYPQLFAMPEYSHLQVIHFKSVKDTQHWLESL
jgi:adenylate kinase family enzyme